ERPAPGVLPGLGPPPLSLSPRGRAGEATSESWASPPQRPGPRKKSRAGGTVAPVRDAACPAAAGLPFADYTNVAGAVKGAAGRGRSPLPAGQLLHQRPRVVKAAQRFQDAARVDGDVAG